MTERSNDNRRSAERERQRLPWWQPWAALASFAFLLNFPWELLQVPFYVGMKDAPHWPATLFCLRASGGDVLILLSAYGAVAAVAGRDWLTRPKPPTSPPSSAWDS